MMLENLTPEKNETITIDSQVSNDFEIKIMEHAGIYNLDLISLEDKSIKATIQGVNVSQIKKAVKQLNQIIFYVFE
jgi:hypothetical protein